jgi:hypothetical protein
MCLVTRSIRTTRGTRNDRPAVRRRSALLGVRLMPAYSADKPSAANIAPASFLMIWRPYGAPSVARKSLVGLRLGLGF